MRDNTELKHCTVSDARIEAENIKALHHAKSHIDVQRRKLTCEHSQEPRNSIELCGRTERQRREISAFVIKHLKLLFQAVFSLLSSHRDEGCLFSLLLLLFKEPRRTKTKDEITPVT